MFGGFNGTESTFDSTTLANRDLVANKVVLSGDLNQDDNTVGMSENSHHLIYYYSLSSPVASTIDGFTIRAGRATDSPIGQN